MGEWSEYFEDFPEENPANWVNGTYLGPQKAQEFHARQMAAHAKLQQDQSALNSEIRRMISEGKARAAAKGGKPAASA